jgi:hypothetical protein
MRVTHAFLAAVGLLATAPRAQGEIVYGQTKATRQEPERNYMVEIKLGPYRPLVHRESALNGSDPYREIFGNSAMLMFELEAERYLWQKFGTVALGLSVGYAEKFAPARLSSDPNVLAGESTALKVVPVRLFALYRFDHPARHLNFPLIPYGKAGLVVTPWWVTKGGKTEFADGKRGAGIRYGYALVGGLAFMLDFLEPRMAKDFTTDLGVAHSYLFAEFMLENVNNFGQGGLDLSSRHWMFGFGVDF